MAKKHIKWPIPGRNPKPAPDTATIKGSQTSPSSFVKAADELESALDQWWSNGAELPQSVPNHANFYDWISEWLGPPEQFPIINRTHSNLDSCYSARLFAFSRAYSKYKADVQVEKPLDRSKAKGALKTFNKFKLLFGAFHNFSERGQQVIEALALELDRTGPLDRDLGSCSQAQLRFRLNAALVKGLDKTAFKIIGKLKESSHDPGEIDYLEATAYFRSNDLKEAERIALTIPEGTIDYPAAQGLILECFAYQGKFVELFARLKSLGPDRVTPAFFAYLLQVALLHSEDPKAVLSELETLENANSWGRPITMDDEFWPVFNRHSCIVATRFVESFHQYQESLEAISQHHVATDDQSLVTSPEKTDATEEDELSDLGPSLNRLLPALVLDANLLEKVQDMQETPHVAICNRLLRSHASPTFDDVHTALMVQFRLGASNAFVDQVIRLHSETPPPREADAIATRMRELLELAYVEAKAIQHPAIKQLEQKLARTGLDSRRLGELGSSTESREIRDSLSPMGRLAFDSVQCLCKAAQGHSNDWQDAGMIALGFFRILELELNHRLLTPMREQGSTGPIESLLENPAPAGSHETSNQRKAREKAVDFWRRMKPNLVDVLRGRKSGLELGPLHLLLEKCRTENGPDAAIKKVVRDPILSRLTESGKTAFLCGDLSKAIAPDVREKFRNPPAHTRFLPLPVALECKGPRRGCVKEFQCLDLQVISSKSLMPSAHAYPLPSSSVLLLEPSDSLSVSVHSRKFTRPRLFQCREKKSVIFQKSTNLDRGYRWVYR